MSPAFVRRLRVPVSFLAGAALLAGASPSREGLLAAGLAVALCGECLRLWAAVQLRKNRELASTGPYAWVRHPLYLGSALMTAGLLVALSDPARPRLTAALWLGVAGAFAWLHLHAVQEEERHLAGLFGERYAAYRREVPALLPSPLRLGRALRSSRFDGTLLLKNGELLTLGALAAVVGLLALRLP